MKIVTMAIIIIVLVLCGYSVYKYNFQKKRSNAQAKTGTQPGNFKKKLKDYTWWEWTIFVVGAMSLISILVVIFFPLGSGPAVFTTSGEVPPVSDPKFVNILSDSLVLPARQGEPITIINNGDAFLKSFLADIDNAHSYIDVMVYIWTDGKMSDQVLEHLDTKLKEGVQVRIMIDAYGSKTGAPKKQFETFKALGGKIATFHSFTIAPWNIARNQGRNHRRAIVIDGKVGYTGGMTVSDPWLGTASNPKEYRDMMFRATGPMVGDIQGAFSELWTSMTGEFLVGGVFNSQAASAGQKSVLQYIPLASVPSPDSLTLQKFLLLSFLGSQQKIYITNPYFLPDLSFRKALIDKAKAGVDVRVLVPNKYNDIPSLRYASHYWYEGLLQAGVKIYEYQPTFIHTKAIVIDGTWSIIGSANMDNRSRKLNNEDVFGVLDKPFGQALENTFLEDLRQAKEITLSEWKKRSIWERIREVFDLKFVQQY